MNAKEKLADYQRQFGVYAEANSEVMGAFGATVTAECIYIFTLKDLSWIMVPQ